MPMISANSTTAYLQASKSYPAGVEFNEWGSDVDPIAFDDIEIVKTEMNMNGSLQRLEHTVGAPLGHIAGSGQHACCT